MDEGIIAACGLGAALDDVAGGVGPGQVVPVRGSPAEMPGRWPRHKGGVGHASADDNVCSLLQCPGNAPAAQVGIGGNGKGPGVGQADAFIDVGESRAFLLELGDTRHQVVTGYVSDFRCQAKRCGNVF